MPRHQELVRPEAQLYQDILTWSLLQFSFSNCRTYFCIIEKPDLLYADMLVL